MRNNKPNNVTPTELGVFKKVRHKQNVMGSAFRRLNIDSSRQLHMVPWQFRCYTKNASSSRRLRGN